jgi:hypothetical protein
MEKPWNLIQNRKEQGCINIHIVGDYVQTAGIHIRSRFFGRDGIVLNFGVTGTNANTTIAPEVGHYFELDHTHQYSNRGKCRKEPVDRNRTFPFFGFCPFLRLCWYAAEIRSAAYQQNKFDHRRLVGKLSKDKRLIPTKAWKSTLI